MQAITQIVGNICLGLAAFLYLVPLPLILADVGRKKDEGGALWGGIFVLGPMSLLLLVALLLVVPRGGFDWLEIKRWSQGALVVLAGLALAVVTFFSYLGRIEPPNQLPWTARPILGWALFVFPLISFFFLAVALNPKFGSGIPAIISRAPFAIVAIASVLVCVAMLGEWAVRANKHQVARVQRVVEAQSQRDRDIMASVQGMNPTDHFADLLGFANRFENEDIREVAIAKARSRPDFREALIKVLESWRAESALVYLDACDMPAEDKTALAEPIRAAIVELTKQVQDAVERTHTFYAEQFNWNTRLIISAAGKFRGHGTDYLPAIRAYRNAMDSPRTSNVRLEAREQLDAWFKHQKK